MIERYGTASAWAQWFEKHEGVSISHVTILSRLSIVRVVGVSAKNAKGHIHKNGLFAESDVRSVCADLLNPSLVRGFENGYANIDGVRHANVLFLARFLGVSASCLSSRLASSGIIPVAGRLKGGHINDLYPEPAVRKLCSDLLAPLPKADKTGFASIGGIRHGSIRSLPACSGFSNQSINSRIKSSGLKPVQGKNGSGRPCDLWPEPAIRKLCSDLLEPLPEADKAGFVSVGGVRHGPREALARLLGVCKSTIFSRLASSIIVPIPGLDSQGRPVNLYSEPAVRDLCADLLDTNLVQAGENGFAEVDGVSHGTVKAFSRLLFVSVEAIQFRVQTSAFVPVRGKDKMGKICKLYPEPAMRELCGDILGKPICGADGFAEINKIRHGTVFSLSLELGISAPAVKSHIQFSGLKPVRGKDRSGNVCDLYPEPAVRDLCDDLIDPSLIRAPDAGVVDIAGVLHGHIKALANLIGVSNTDHRIPHLLIGHCPS